VRATKAVVLASVLFPLLAAGASAQTDWDDPGRRSGFIIGFGAGPALTHVATSGTLGGDTNRAGGAIDFRIGAEVGSTMLFLLWQASLIDAADEGTADAVATGMSGLGATFAATNRLLVTVGAGVGSWTELCLWFCGTGDVEENGFGAMAGIGYEFADLWVVDLSANFAALDHPGNVLNVSMKISVLSH